MLKLMGGASDQVRCSSRNIAWIECIGVGVESIYKCDNSQHLQHIICQSIFSCLSHFTRTGEMRALPEFDMTGRGLGHLANAHAFFNYNWTEFRVNYPNVSI